MSDLKKLVVIARYASGREERHYVKATKGPQNKKLKTLLDQLNAFPKVVDVRVVNPNKELFRGE